MKVVIKIDCETDGFKYHVRGEVSKILNKLVSEQLDNNSFMYGVDKIALQDAKGNSCGTFEVIQ